MTNSFALFFVIALITSSSKLMAEDIATNSALNRLLFGDSDLSSDTKVRTGDSARFEKYDWDLRGSALNRDMEITLKSYLANKKIELDVSAIEIKEFILGRLNNDTPNALIALYLASGYDGGHGYGFYIAILDRDTNKLITDIQVGSKGTRTTTLNKIEDSLIYLDTEYIRPGDGFCCPSGRGVAVYGFSGKRVWPLNQF
ncbi:hypothetical protein [Marinobacterium sp. xm-d-543]|uniref:hypothetical protein n=1 Tax=Marinobacterium sp. xm-d-543 TaxID=2497740 RepID=UPI001569DAD3|nr:hypothetical protein [Marinobacterium sp. xm-d-543]